MKKYLLHYYKKSISSDKVMVVTIREYAEDVISNIKATSEWSYDVVALAFLDEEVDVSEVAGIPVVAHGDDFLENAKQVAMDVAFLYLPTRIWFNIVNICTTCITHVMINIYSLSCVVENNFCITQAFLATV